MTLAPNTESLAYKNLKPNYERDMIKYSWKKYIRELFPFVFPYRFTIATVLLFTFVSVSLDLLEPIIYKKVLNDLSGVYVHKTYKENINVSAEDLLSMTKIKHERGKVRPRTTDQAFETLVIAALMLFVINIISHIFDLMADYYSAKYANRIEQDFIEKAFGHVLRLKLQFFSKHTAASLAKRIDQTDQIGSGVQTLVEGLSREIFKLIGATSIMFFHHPKLAIASLITLPTYLFVSRRMAVKLEGTSQEYLETWDDVSTNLQDNLNHVKTVKTSGAESRVVQKFKQTLEKALGQYLSRSKIEDTYIFFQNSCIHAGRLIVLIYGSYQVVEHQLTPGDVVMFVSLLDQMYEPIDELTSHAVNIQIEKISIARGLSLFHSGREEKKGIEFQIKDASVEFSDVRFSYKKNQEILHGINFKLKPNSYNVLVGTSGSGKSTILDLLLNFYSVDSGSILIDNKEVKEMDTSFLRSQIGLVATDGAIFRGSVKDNLLFKNPDASESEISEAILCSGLEKTIKRLPEGLETEIGDMGIGLSVGERQRLQFARMLISKPKIILLDEATANLDYSTEGDIKALLLKMAGKTTVLVVAHRFSMVEGAEHVIVLNNGNITSQGSLEEVIQSNAWFRGMANSQSEAT